MEVETSEGSEGLQEELMQYNSSKRSRKYESDTETWSLQV